MNTFAGRNLSRWTAVFVALALLCTLPVALGESAMPFAGGEGTEASPYVIETAAQLDSVREHLSAHFILMADIDLSAYESWAPIGT